MRRLLFDCLIGPAFWVLDRLTPKDDRRWGFAPHHIKSGQFIENPRAVYECVKASPDVIKVILARDEPLDFEPEPGSQTRVLKLKSWRGLTGLLRCRVLFVTHSIAMDYSMRWPGGRFSVLRVAMRNRVVVNLWHGIPLKKLYALTHPEVRARLDRVRYRRWERRHYAGLVASSQVDSYAMAAAFHPLPYERIMVTGLPRNDFLVAPPDRLPGRLRQDVEMLRQLKAGRRLVVYAPTYRQSAVVDSARCYQFTAGEMEQLKAVLRRHNAILGFRLHYFRNSRDVFNMEAYLDNELIHDLGHLRVPEIAPVVREADLVISDYSSVFLEALYLNIPLLGFVYDLEHYRDHEDGLMYDLDMIFPGPMAKDFPGLLAQLDAGLGGGGQAQSAQYQFARKFFFAHTDGANARRLVNRVRQLVQGRGAKRMDGGAAGDTQRGKVA